MLSIARQELANPGMEAKPRTASLVMATGGLAYRRQCCKLKLAVQYSYVHPFLGHLNVVNNCRLHAAAQSRAARAKRRTGQYFRDSERGTPASSGFSARGERISLSFRLAQRP